MASSHAGTFAFIGPIPSEYLEYWQRYESLSISSDTITVSHTITFCRPIPNDHFDCTVQNAVPGTTDCGSYTRDLKNVPLDDLPSGGPCTSDMRISPSEMAYAYIRLNNYPKTGGSITQTWKNRDTGQILATFTYQIGVVDPSWTNWYSFVWSYIGHFSWEIVLPGNYQWIVTTTWGNATIDFVVVDTTPVLNSISIIPTTSSINIGYTRQFTASCLDQYGASITCPTLTWNSSNGFAPINSSGLVTGNGECASNITCSGGGKTSNIAVLTVVAVVGFITISPLTASLNIGATQQLTATCKDFANVNTITCPPSMIWYTSNSSIAAVNSSTGLVTAGSTPGIANITCTGGGKNSTAPSVITVIGPLNTITISPTPVSLNIGNTQLLTAVCKDAGNNILICPTLTWSSSDPSKATVASTGLVTALVITVSAGTANISCSGGGKTSNSSIITIIGPLNTITISPTQASLIIGNTQLLTAICKDAGNNVLTCPILTWSSSDSSKATVASTGLVTALVITVSAGTANISCSGGGKTSNSSIITVIPPANITIQSITAGGISCTSGCSLTCTENCPAIVDIIVTWANSGGVNGTFTPWVIIAGGNSIPGTQITIAPGLTGITTFSSVSLPQGIPGLCFYIGIVT